MATTQEKTGADRDLQLSKDQANSESISSKRSSAEMLAMVKIRCRMEHKVQPLHPELQKLAIRVRKLVSNQILVYA
jgi:hypothetical protein